MNMSGDWTRGYFDEPYEQLHPFPDETQTAEEVEALAGLLPAPPTRVLDVACGRGRHAVALARRGFDVVGVDTSPAFLAAARGTAPERAIEFIEGDMRDLAFDREFDAAVSMFTAWGYFDDVTNEDVLRRIAQSLRPDGTFVMQIVQRDWLVRNYRPQGWAQLDDGSFVVQDRTFDQVSGTNRVISRWRTLSGEARERWHQIRVYTPTEVDGMLRRVGLLPTGWFGGFSLQPLALDSRWMVVVAQRDQSS
jgi:SAM-dependent methyltransferase